MVALGTIVYDLAASLGQYVFVEFFATGVCPSVSIGSSNDAVTIAPGSTAGSITVTASVGDITDTFTSALVLTGPARVRVLFHQPVGSAAWTASLQVGTGSDATGARSLTAARTDLFTQATVQGVSGATIEGLQVTLETVMPANVPFAPQAFLDPSLNPLTVVPEIPPGTAGVDICQTMAVAELGYFRFDEYGYPRFSNRETIANSPLTRTITSSQSLKDFTTSQGSSTQYGAIAVPYTDWNFSTPGLVFTLGSIKKIPKRSTGARAVTWLQPLGDGVLAAGIDATPTLLPDGHTVTDGNSWYRSSADQYGILPGPALNITITPVTPGTVRISVENPSSGDAYLTTPSTYVDLTAGSTGSGLWIGGTAATAGNESTVTVTSSSHGGETYTVPSNAYLQDHDTAVAIGTWLRNRLATPIRDFGDCDIVPDDRTQITDLVLLQDPDRSHVNEYVRIWASSFSASFEKGSESWEQKISVGALGAPKAWLLGIPGRSELGTTTYAY